MNPPRRFVDADIVARAAVVIGSTMPDDGIDRNAGYLWTANFSVPRYYDRTATQAECFAHANCGAAAPAHCVGYAITRNAPADCHTGCDGDLYTGCGAAAGLVEGAAATIDCGKVGLTCDVARICASSGTAETCDAASYLPTCTVDDRPGICDHGLVSRGRPCGELGLACDAGSCVGKGAACSPGGMTIYGSAVVKFAPLSCASGSLQACVNGHAASEPCALFGPGFACQSFNGRPFCGLASECEPLNEGVSSSTHPARCDGNAVVFCNAGRLEHIDCTSLGFQSCEIDKSKGHFGCLPGLAP